jgi:hypothetical protein
MIADFEPNAHPATKRIMLRLMPAEGGEPKVIAYLYGGQGTINVPSWAPDSKHIAFVSNSGKYGYRHHNNQDSRKSKKKPLLYRQIIRS